MEGLIYGGKFAFQNRLGLPYSWKEIYRFCFVLLCIWRAYIRRGDLTEGFLRYEFGGLIFGGAHTWRGLFSEFYGILLGSRSLVGTPSGVSRFDLFRQFCIQEFSADTQLHELAQQRGKLGRL